MAKRVDLGALLDRTDEPDENGKPADDQAVDANDGRSRGGLRAAKPRRTKTPRPKAGEIRDCKFSVAVSRFERLRQTAIYRNVNMSVIVDELLDRHLPYFDVVKRDKPPAAGD